MTSQDTLRLDAALVQRGHASSRTRAAQLVRGGAVRVSGRLERRPSAAVRPSDTLELDAGSQETFVSRAAHKLVGALESAARVLPPGIVLAGRHALDAGASTGGFTQVLLGGGVHCVDAVDVGHGQLSALVRAEERVRVREGLNVRDLEVDDLGERPDVVVADLSFISLRLVVGRLLAVARPGADVLVMVKPQFEVGRERLGSGGVVSSPELRVEAVRGVAAAAVAAGAQVLAVLPSVLPGEAGNREYFLWLRAADGDAAPAWPDVERAVLQAVRRAVGDDEPSRVQPLDEGEESL